MAYFIYDMLQYFHNQANFSGIWTDMNEISGFCEGNWPNQCSITVNPPAELLEHSYKLENDEKIYSTRLLNEKSNSKNRIDFNLPSVSLTGIQPPFNSSILPYVPGIVPLENKTLSIDAYHYGGVLELNFHSLNGFLQDATSFDILKNDLNFPQPFILTRESIPGSGQFATHWTGDNAAEFDYMSISIPEIFNFQLFGIPMTGADMCGFAGNTTAQLCTRWYQLGAFYPFMRNHNSNVSIPQEPFAFDKSTLNAARSSTYLRYSILKWYYSIYVRNQGIGTVFRPLFFDFLDDVNLFGLETQFLVGSELMVAPALFENQTNISIYFPAQSKWFYFVNGSLAQDYSFTPESIIVEAPNNTVAPVFIKAGSIIPVQNFSLIHNTNDLNNTFNLTIALAQVDEDTYSATGLIMGIENFGDYNSIEQCIDGNNCLINITVIAEVTSSDVTFNVTFVPQQPNTTLENIYINGYNFYGVRTTICPPYDTSCADIDHTFYYEVPIPSPIVANSYVIISL